MTGLITRGVIAQEVSVPAVTIGAYDYPPFGFAENSQQTGYSLDILKEAVRRAGLSFSIEDFPVVRATELLHGTPNFIIAGTLTPEAVVRYGSSHWPFCFETASHALLVKADSPYNRLEDIPRSASIGAFLGYTLKKHFTELGYDLQLASENWQVAEMLVRGRVEAWATFESSAYYLMEAKNIPLNSVRSIPIKQFPFCAIASRGTNPEVLTRLRAAYLSMEADGTRKAIRSRYARFLGADNPYSAIPKLP
ncbi:substrate-binding periplasmic protein [Paramagnetospirillum magnetotacticum]|uniref:substrate-binding periplasmic protein n=1 Tax=Paramagnetospirillum magnetotacticum TaxID=188 RepID=UPI001364BE05|nr:transporter substrate-binding domain-containing protein [Paramagnetospirillum magnetotacticum]